MTFGKVLRKYQYKYNLYKVNIENDRYEKNNVFAFISLK